ncbi:hypothetical protein LINPERHAP1_LOCUS38112 [Linum perenne]
MWSWKLDLGITRVGQRVPEIVNSFETASFEVRSGGGRRWKKKQEHDQQGQERISFHSHL